jgi:hypothetical protein
MIWLLVGYMYLYIHRPFEVWPALGEIRLELLYMIVTIAVWAIMAPKHWPCNFMNWAYVAFAGALLICWIVSPWRDLEGDHPSEVEKYYKGLVFYLLLITTIREEFQLKTIINAFVIVMSVYMLHSLWEFHNGRHEYRMDTVRMIGVDSSLGNPNALAGSVTYTLPFVIPAWMSAKSKWWRGYLVGHALLSVACIVLTGSRGGFLGLLLFGFFFGVRVGKIWQGLLAVTIGLAVLWALLPPQLQNRFETILWPEVGPANAQESAEGRVDGLLVGLELLQDNLLTGCGPGLWRPATGRELEAHNLCGELLGEMGTLGALTFASILAGFLINRNRILRLYAQEHWEQDFIYHLARAIGTSVVLLLFAGLFGHNLFRCNWLWYGAFLVLAVDIVKRRAQESQSPAPLIAPA